MAQGKGRVECAWPQGTSKRKATPGGVAFFDGNQKDLPINGAHDALHEGVQRFFFGRA